MRTFPGSSSHLERTGALARVARVQGRRALPTCPAPCRPRCPRPHAHAFRVLPRGLVMTRSLPSLGSLAQRPPRANPPADHPPPLSTLLPSSHFLARRSLVLTRLVFCVLPPPGGRRLRESGPGAAPSAQWMLAECVTRMCARRQEGL